MQWNLMKSLGGLEKSGIAPKLGNRQERALGLEESQGEPT